VMGTIGFGYAFINRKRRSRFATCGATCLRIFFYAWQVTRPLHSPALIATLVVGGMYDGSNDTREAVVIGTILAFMFSWPNISETLCCPFRYFRTVFFTVHFFAASLFAVCIWRYDLGAHVSSSEVQGSAPGVILAVLVLGLGVLLGLSILLVAVASLKAVCDNCGDLRFAFWSLNWTQLAATFRAASVKVAQRRFFAVMFALWNLDWARTVRPLRASIFAALLFVSAYFLLLGFWNSVWNIEHPAGPAPADGVNIIDYVAFVALFRPNEEIGREPLCPAADSHAYIFRHGKGADIILDHYRSFVADCDPSPSSRKVPYPTKLVPGG
jgi:hypothetical protein